MRIPDNTLYTSRLRTYGTAGLEAVDIAEQAGCPALYKAKYVEQQVKEPQSEPAAYGALIHDALFIAEEENVPLVPDALEKAWKQSDIPLGPQFWEEAIADLDAYMARPDDGLVTLAVEQHLTMPLMEYRDAQWFFGGYIDKISIDPNDSSVVYVDDYKTNRAPPSQADLDSDVQFTGYMLLVEANLERWLPGVDPQEITIVGRMEAIKWYTLSTYRERWQLEQYADFLRAMAKRIIDDEEGEPVLNPACGWCPIKFDCKEYKRLPGAGVTLADRMSTTTDLTQRAYLMQQAELTVKALKPGIEAVKAELLGEAQSRGEPIVVNGIAYAQGEQWATDTEILELSRIMGDDFVNVASVTQKAVNEWVKKHPDKKEEVEACFKRYPKGVRLTAKKADGGGS